MPNNQILTIDMITRELMFQLENNLAFTKYVRRNLVDDQFGRTGAKIGALSTFRSGRVIQIQALEEQSVALSLIQGGVDREFSSADLLLSIDDFSERFLKTDAATIANQIDLEGMSLYKDIYNTVGTPGTIPNSLLTYRNAGVKLSQEAVPRGTAVRNMVIDDQMEATITDALQGLFHSTPQIERQYEEGMMGMAAGFKWSADQNTNTHVAGQFTTGSTPVVNGANQTGSSLVTNGWANNTQVLNHGDVFTIPGVFAVNPRNRRSTGALRQFVASADVTSDGAGNATIPIKPAITTTGAYQTVTASPANGAAIQPLGTEGGSSPQGLAFHTDAFVFASVPLPQPNGVHQASVISDSQLGLSIRMLWDYDAVNDVFICRTDILYGWVTARSELACRVAS